MATKEITSAKKRVKAAFIINPISGTSRKEGLSGLLQQHLNPARIRFCCEETRYSGHGRKLAARFLRKGYTLIVAVGGDGTVNEVASVVNKSKAVLGVLPVGSGNGFARSLGIPLNLTDAIAALNQPWVIKVDTGMINKRPFFCTCGTGFDARVGQVFHDLKGRGFFNYIRAVVREYFWYRPKQYRLIIDGERVTERAFMVTFANSGQYGNNAYISPKAKMNDGKLDVCIVRAFPKVGSLILGIRLFNRTMHRSRYVKIIRARKALLIGRKKTTMHIDGDPCVLKGDIKVRVQPKTLKVAIPKA